MVQSFRRRSCCPITQVKIWPLPKGERERHVAEKLHGHPTGLPFHPCQSNLCQGTECHVVPGFAWKSTRRPLDLGLPKTGYGPIGCHESWPGITSAGPTPPAGRALLHCGKGFLAASVLLPAWCPDGKEWLQGLLRGAKFGRALSGASSICSQSRNLQLVHGSKSGTIRAQVHRRPLVEQHSRDRMQRSSQEEAAPRSGHNLRVYLAWALWLHPHFSPP